MNIRYIDAGVAMAEIELRDGILPLMPAEFYDQWPRDSIRLWCHHYARYGLPTAELVAWLHMKIGGRTAIEIGAGSGDLAHHLGIPATDNRMQEWPDVKLYYGAARQPTIRYGGNVEGLDAVNAVEKHKPHVVVASWVTEWVDPTRPVPAHGGNMYGVKEDQIVRQCEYILIGNIDIHGKKKIMDFPHEEHALPFIRSRATNPSLDRVWIWEQI